jgi:nucleotide-binding universal stress UspA family protein
MRVLVAVDDSPVREEVAAAAAHLLDTHDEVYLLTVIDPREIRETIMNDGSAGRTVPVGYPTSSGISLTVHQPTRAIAEDVTQAAQRVEGERAEALAALAARHLPYIRHHVRVEVGADVAGCILRVAQELGAHGIAMGTRGRGALPQVLLGSVAEQVLRRSAVPVMIVRSGMQVPRVEPAVVTNAS